MKKNFYFLLFILCFTLAGCSSQADYDLKSVIAVITISTITILFFVLAGQPDLHRGGRALA